ncbi:hypothetical protein BLNAU_603 [Blattamonas nauphoetae]|uniref:Uncharacterized protein n=1 Tax=Blattamonas nauphoetae TaxID=2049346 RepID=A0ABQ9YLY7_9EUKA|nr:hypothetical protein BLNAU_603 [Blattamonas nauphoetae]
MAITLVDVHITWIGGSDGITTFEGRETSELFSKDISLVCVGEAKSQYSFLIFWPSLMILVMVVGERAFAQTEREIAELRGIPLQHKSA